MRNIAEKWSMQRVDENGRCKGLMKITVIEENQVTMTVQQKAASLKIFYQGTLVIENVHPGIQVLKAFHVQKDVHQEFELMRSPPQEPGIEACLADERGDKDAQTEDQKRKVSYQARAMMTLSKSIK
jgi:hypothetical protein